MSFCGKPSCDQCEAYVEARGEHDHSQHEPELVAETVMAQRLWRWLPSKGLRGMRTTWDSGFMEASCSSGHQSPHWTPAAYDQWRTGTAGMIQTTTFGQHPVDAPCLCGVNAYKLTHLFDPVDLTWARGVDQSLWSSSFTDALAVLGIVELGGEVHEYEKGYRAQYARIVEGTVLTTLPIDPEVLTELEEQYDAPFRVQSYDEWKTEWEATYGRDRETEASDQGSETGEGSGYSTGGTVQGARSVQVTMQANTAALQKAFQQAYLSTWAAFDEVEPESWWERYKKSWRDDWRLGKDLVVLRVGYNLATAYLAVYLAWMAGELAGLL